MEAIWWRYTYMWCINVEGFVYYAIVKSFVEIKKISVISCLLLLQICHGLQNYFNPSPGTESN